MVAVRGGGRCRRPGFAAVSAGADGLNPSWPEAGMGLALRGTSEPILRAPICRTFTGGLRGGILAGSFVNAPVLGGQYPGKTAGHGVVESIDPGGNGGIADAIQPGHVRAAQVLVGCRVAPPEVQQQLPRT